MEKLIEKYCQRVAEMDDRTSPEDWPEAMLITGAELAELLFDFAREVIGFPAEINPDLTDILGMPNFRAGPIARAFVKAGRAAIKSHAEEEQAFVLHWALGLYLKHGAGWRQQAQTELNQIIDEARAKQVKPAPAEKPPGPHMPPGIRPGVKTQVA